MKHRIAFAASAALLLVACSKPHAGTGNARVDGLLRQMTLQEKIALIHGVPEDPATAQGQAGYLPGLPRLGVPALRFTDGPPGVFNRNPSTGMTSTMGLAATFSREDARQNGVVIGRDARALGQQVVLEPFINLARDFRFARAYNTYGEDPLLSGQLAAALIEGVQAQGVMAQVKHFVAYDGGMDVDVSPQALRELYVAPFADAVAAGVSSVMCSYNHVNGPFACGSGPVLNDILRSELGFKGFVTSDWGGTHSTLFVKEGLDLEMPGNVEGSGDRSTYFLARTGGGATATGDRAGGPGAFPGGVAPGTAIGGIAPEEGAPGPRGNGNRRGGEPPLGVLAAIEDGRIGESDIDTAVGRILLQMDRFGYLDKPPSLQVTAVDTDFDAPVVRRTAERSAVLLKNDGELLPLRDAELGTAVFIGPGAGQTVAIGTTGEKALGFPERRIGPVAALEKIAGRGLSYLPANDMTGVAVPAALLTHDGKPGLAHTDGTGGRATVDAVLDFTRKSGNALAGGSQHSWSGVLNVPSAGSYTLALQIIAAGGSVSLDGKPVISVAGRAGRGVPMSAMQDNVLPTTDNLDNARVQLDLKPGAHALQVEVAGSDAAQPLQVRLAWVTPQKHQADYAAAINAAARATRAVVFVWGRDKPAVFALPGDQDRLVSDIAAVNRNTIVVLNTSLPVAMPWLPKVKAVVQMWWPGDEGGPATANVLSGRVNPAGRLPVTWPQSLSQMPAEDPAHPERVSRGVDGKTSYSEGLFMGYRWFDQQALEPLFPFGHGLSYSHFEYADLKVERATDTSAGPAADGGLRVTFSVTNTGRLAGDEVPQVYLDAPRQPPPGAQFAVRTLVGFDRITLDAGETKRVTIRVPPRGLQYWSEAGRSWTTATGTRTIEVGASSRDLRLRTDVTIG